MIQKRLTPILCVVILILAMLACSSGAPAATATPVPPTNTSVPPTNTLEPTSTPLPTATPNVAATQAYNDMFALVEKANSTGQLPSTKGIFYTLKDFSYEWAQMNYYDFYDTGLIVDNFAVKAHFKWSSAIANPEPSGCGFAYRVGDNASHYLVYLDRAAVNMGVYVPNIDRSGSYQIGAAQGSGHMKQAFGNPAEADFALVVNEGNAYAYVDGEFKAQYNLYSDYYKYKQGALAFTIVSGTNKDFGTKCDMTNVELWKVNP